MDRYELRIKSTFYKKYILDLDYKIQHFMLQLGLI